MFEPDLTGFSYSFTDDGHYEEAYYRAVANRKTFPSPLATKEISLIRICTDTAPKSPATDPACPKGIMQFQHGSYTKNANGSLTLTPIGVDGRQLLSDPCNYQNSIFTRYNQSELFKTYEVLKDAYSQSQRLNLFGFDGAPLNPMYLAYKPPQMLPTETLNPTASSTGGSSQSTGTGSSKLKKRYHGGDEHIPDDDEDITPLPFTKDGAFIRKGDRRDPINADKWWWIGVGMTALGGIGYFCF